MLGPLRGSLGPLGMAAGVPKWYLAGGIAAANCIAAYTPKGAASLAASYDNNAAPGNGLADGTYDAAPGVAPTWASATGWTFLAASTQYLNTGITPTNNQAWSGFAQFANVVNSPTVSGVIFFACADASGNLPYFGVNPRNYGTRRYFNAQPVSGGIAEVGSGNMAIVGQQGYLNGIADGGLSASNIGAFGTIAIGRLGLYPGFYLSGDVSAIAIYNVTPAAPQITALYAAMAAL